MQIPQQPKFFYQSDFERLLERSKNILRVFAAWDINNTYKTDVWVNSLYSEENTIEEVEAAISDLVRDGWIMQAGLKFSLSPSVIAIVRNVRTILLHEMEQNSQFNVESFKALTPIQRSALIYLHIIKEGYNPIMLYDILSEEFTDLTQEKLNAELVALEQDGWIGSRFLDGKERWGIFNCRVKVAMDLIQQHFKKPNEQ